MNLDDTSTFARIDPKDMLAQIDGLPDQLHTAWQLGSNLPLPAWMGIRQVIIAGLGGSAIGGDLVSAYVEPACRLPVVVHRDYGLPAWARGKDTLVIASSHSGNTEETLSSLKTSLEQGCHTLVVSTGGQLADAAQKAGVPWWRFEHHSQPRAAVGFSFGLLLAILTRLGLLPDPSEAIRETVALMKAQQSHLIAGVPVAKNPAKRIAGQLMGRWVTVFGAGVLAPVARRWKCQINELAKAWAQFDLLPEGDHNTLEGVHFPQEILPRMMALFLRGPADHPEHRRRLDLTRRFLMLEGINTDFIDAQGNDPLANQWTMLHFGDYTAYYLAMAYGIDPTPVETLQAFKKEILAAGSV